MTKQAVVAFVDETSGQAPVFGMLHRAADSPGDLLVLTHGAVIPWEALLIGADKRSRLHDGLWPSDHAAVEAGVIVGSK